MGSLREEEIVLVGHNRFSVFRRVVASFSSRLSRESVNHEITISSGKTRTDKTHSIVIKIITY